MSIFFSDAGYQSALSKAYDRAGKHQIDVTSIIEEAEAPRTNTQRRLRWAYKYFNAKGKFPAQTRNSTPELQSMEIHECRYCHSEVWYPAGSDVDPVKVFCCDRCENEYRDLGGW